MKVMRNANGLPVKLLRGGSSKGVFVRASDLPPPGEERDALILRLFGAPDIRQIDGLGGGDKLTSKLAVMSEPTRDDCDISYLFAQIGTEYPDVDWHSNCGNISSGAALFAALDNVGVTEGTVQTIAIEQANTGRRLVATVPMKGNTPERNGTFEIGGVPGEGPRIDLDFADFAGSCLHRGLFPTGARVERLQLADGLSLQVSILDMANLNVIVAASDLAVDLSYPMDRLQSDDALLNRLDEIRAATLLRLGLATPNNVAETIRRSVNPLVQIVAPSRSYWDLNGKAVPVESHDVLSRSYARRAFSKAFPATGAIGTAVGAFLSGTQATSYGSSAKHPNVLRIGHPSGTLSVQVQLEDSEAVPKIYMACIGRTARILMEGIAYLD